MCGRLITKGDTLEYLDSALRRFPTLLTLEDLVCRHGGEWGFDQKTIWVACAAQNISTRSPEAPVTRDTLVLGAAVVRNYWVILDSFFCSSESLLGGFYMYGHSTEA